MDKYFIDSLQTVIKNMGSTIEELETLVKTAGLSFFRIARKLENDVNKMKKNKLFGGEEYRRDVCGKYIYVVQVYQKAQQYMEMSCDDFKRKRDQISRRIDLFDRDNDHTNLNYYNCL